MYESPNPNITNNIFTFLIFPIKSLNLTYNSFVFIAIQSLDAHTICFVATYFKIFFNQHISHHIFLSQQSYNQIVNFYPPPFLTLFNHETSIIFLSCFDYKYMAVTIRIIVIMIHLIKIYLVLFAFCY